MPRIRCAPMWSLVLSSATLLAPLAGTACSIESVKIGGEAQQGAGFATSKLDILFVVDNSARMETKQRELGIAAKRMLEVLEPQCIEDGVIIDKVPLDGRCPRGSRQFAPLDIHVGVITSSIGGFGTTSCGDDPAYHNDDRRELVHREPPNETLSFLAPEGFLAAPGGPQLASEVDRLLRGVGQNGCGIEAPLEALYQFLSAPDPYERVELEDGVARYVSVSTPILQQRRAFLRPDSAVLVVILSDEDDASVNPIATSGSGWAWVSNDFPTSSLVPSTVADAPGRKREEARFFGGTTAPRGSSACLSDVDARACTSCVFRYGCARFFDQETCDALETDPRCVENDGYCTQEEDNLGVRFHRMKSRYGIEPRFPVDRYVAALTNDLIADRAHAVDAQGDYVVPSGTDATPCMNPLFAARIPAGQGEELCRLPRGDRPKDAVQVVVLTGVPATLLPRDGEPSAAAFRKILGDAPERERLEGIDPHMQPSILPRAGISTDPTRRDAVNLRDWDTGSTELQLACAWELASPISTTAPGYRSDDCVNPSQSPLCGKDSVVASGAYPGVRHAELARALGARATLGSICGATQKATEPGDRDYVRSLRAAQGKLWRFLRP